MKRAVGATFCATSLLLLLLSFLQEGVGAHDTGAFRSHGGTTTKSVKVTRVNGASPDHGEHTRYYGEKWSDASSDTRTEDRSGWSPYLGRMSGYGITEDADDRNERTAQHDYGDGITERITPYSSGPYYPPPTRSRDVDTGGKGSYSHTRGGTINVHELPAAKTSSNRSSSEERTWDEKGASAVEAKSQPHPIGLINALGGKATTTARSVDLDSRELDSTSITIIASAAGSFIAVMIFLWWCLVESKSEIKDSSRRLLQVFQYLHKFNTDDIDIQLSAAGGFHVAYMNDLAEGINNKENSYRKQLDDTSSSDDGESRGSVSELSKKI